MSSIFSTFWVKINLIDNLFVLNRKNITTESCWVMTEEHKYMTGLYYLSCVHFHFKIQISGLTNNISKSIQRKSVQDKHLTLFLWYIIPVDKIHANIYNKVTINNVIKYQIKFRFTERTKNLTWWYEIM